MKYAEGEKVISGWDYAVPENGTSEDSCNITVTNKRLIFGRKTRRGTEHTEIALDCVKAVEVNNAGANVWAMIIAVIGLILLACLPFVNIILGGKLTVDVVVPLVAAGVVLLLIGVAFIGWKLQVKLYVTCKEQLFAYARKGAERKLIIFRKIKVKKEVLKELREGLTAALLNAGSEE